MALNGSLLLKDSVGRLRTSDVGAAGPVFFNGGTPANAAGRLVTTAGGGGGGDTDPFFANVVSLMHFNGDFTDVKGKVWTPNGNAAATGAGKFGSNSLLLDGNGDFLTGDASTDFAFGTGDFTIEFWFNPVFVNPAITGLVDFRAAQFAASPAIVVDDVGKLAFKPQDTTRIQSTFQFSAGTYGQWWHTAVCRKTGTTRMFINGALEGTPWADSLNYIVGASRPAIGSWYNTGSASGQLNGRIDELRITKGVGRYDAPFTPPTAAFPDAGPADLEVDGAVYQAATGAIVVTTTNPIVVYLGGMPLDSAGALCISVDAVPVTYSAGLAFDAAGRVCTTAS